MNQKEYEQQIENMVEAVAALKTEARTTNLKTAVTNYMSVLAAGFSDNLLPNGMTAEQAAESVINGAECYVNFREQAEEGTPMELTADAVRARIAEQLKNMTVEQGIRYVAMLKVMYRYFMPADGVGQEDAVTEYQRIVQENSHRAPEEQLDDLMESLDSSDFNSILHFAEHVSVKEVAAQPNAQVQMVIQLAAENYLEVEDAVVCGAVMYGETVRGHVGDMRPEADPGVVTVVTSAYFDALHMAAKDMTVEEIYGSLSMLGKVLASALTVATAMMVIFWAYTLAPELVVILANLGVSQEIAKALGLVFFLGVGASQVVKADQYKLEYSSLIKAVECSFGREEHQPLQEEAAHSAPVAEKEHELLTC